MADILVNNEGSIVMLVPNSTAGKAWIDENLQLESWQWLGGGAAIEWRYAPDIVKGMQEDGLEVIPGYAQVTEDDKQWLSRLGITASKKKATEPYMPIRQDVATSTPNMTGVQQPPPASSQVGVEESVAVEQQDKQPQQPEEKEKHTVLPELPNAMFHMAADVEETGGEDLKDEYRGLGSASEFLQRAWGESTKNAVARGYMSGALDALRWAKRISVQEYGLGYDTYVYGGGETAAAPEFDEDPKAMGIVGSSWGGWKRISRYTQESDDGRFTITLIDPTRISRWFLLKDIPTGKSYKDRTMTEAKLRAKRLREAESAIVEPASEEVKAASSPFTNGLLRSKEPEGAGEINEI